MKVSVAWLKEFVDMPESPAQAAALLARRGFDTASLTPAGADVTGVVAGRVDTVEPHPNADKLKVCRVFDGRDHHTVVCGAPNVARGGLYPFARTGARLPGGLTIEPRLLRGVESRGMLCSARELGLAGSADGLYDLPPDTDPGRDMRDLLELDDVILDVEVTPNRPDALSHWGLARELAAGWGRPLKIPPADLPPADVVPHLVTVAEPALCDRYLARVVEGLTVRPAPLRARLRLERCGIRSINNLVDATNYVLLEWGHPLHVFDRDRLTGPLVVRRGRAGETLACLDGVVRPVEGDLVIADDAGPLAVAGVMGGQPSGVTAATTRVVLESARFAPAQVRRTRHRLGLSTESSYRFERGTDADVADLASRRGTALLLEWGGGRCTGAADVGAPRAPPSWVPVSLARVSGLLGFALTAEAAREALRKMDFQVDWAGDEGRVRPPIHRADVQNTADVVEELARQLGYEHVPARVRPAVPPDTIMSRDGSLAIMARDRLLGWGFYEVVLTGLVPRSLWQEWAGPNGENPPELDNPLSLSGDCLNPGLLPNLLMCLAGNVRRGHGSARIFESARVFHRDPSAVREADHLAWAATGHNHGLHWARAARPLDIWDAKAWMEGILTGWRLISVTWGPGGEPFLHPAQSQSLWAKDERLGVYGRLHPRRAEAWRLPADTFVGEINLTAVQRLAREAPCFSGLSRQPALIRDFSLVFPSATPWSAVVVWLNTDCPWVESVQLFDVFTGPDVGADRRSLAFRVVFRHPDRTLTETEAQSLHERVIRGLGDAFQAVPRAAPAEYSA